MQVALQHLFLIKVLSKINFVALKNPLYLLEYKISKKSL